MSRRADTFRRARLTLQTAHLARSSCTACLVLQYNSHPLSFFVRKLNKQHCEVVCEPGISSITAFGVHVLQLCCRSLQPHRKVAQVKARRRADLLALVQVRIRVMGSQEGCGRILGEWVQQTCLSEMHICSGGSHLPRSASPASPPCVSTALQQQHRGHPREGFKETIQISR